MASTGAAAILFYCVALSTMVAVGSAGPADNQPRFISMDALECSNITAETSPRKLVALQGVCPVRFDRMHKDMAAVISSCRGHPSAERCCGAFKTFACPYWDLINDNAINGCANDMFFEIMVRGRLHPGLFSYLCREGPNGLACPPVTNP